MVNGGAVINPFKPTAGAEPPVLVGRERVVQDFCDGIEEGVGAPARLMRITGPRGSGKTVLLTELGDVAKTYGWTVIDVVASGNLTDKIRRALRGCSPRADVSLRANLGLISAQADFVEPIDQPDIREVLTEAATRLTAKGNGLLVTVDEIQDGSEDEIRELAVAVQHLIRERQNIAFAFAGITTGVMNLINGRSLTFLRRAKAEELAAIPVAEVADSFEKTFSQKGIDASDALINKMASATQGYAYLIQLVGYGVFAEAKRHASESLTVTEKDCDNGIARAYRDFDDAVLLPALDELPQRAIEYLLAMTQDEEKSGTGTIARRMGLEPTQLTATRRLLIGRQVIEAPSRGLVRFAIPRLREYLVDNREELLSRF